MTAGINNETDRLGKRDTRLDFYIRRISPVRR